MHLSRRAKDLSWKAFAPDHRLVCPGEAVIEQAKRDFHGCSRQDYSVGMVEAATFPSPCGIQAGAPREAFDILPTSSSVHSRTLESVHL